MGNRIEMGAVESTKQDDATTHAFTVINECFEQLSELPTESGVVQPTSYQPIYEQLAGYLSHDTRIAVRFEVATRLSACDSHESRALLEQIAQEDASPLVRHEAIFGLAQIGTNETMAFLSDIGLRDPSHVVRHEAAIALHGIGDATVLPQLREGLYDPDNLVAESCQVAIDKIRYRLVAGKM